MTKQEVLDGLVNYLDELYSPKKWWLEFASDRLFDLVINKGFQALEDNFPVLAAEFLEAGENFLTANMNGLVDDVADFGAQLFKLLVFKKSSK